MTEQDFLKLIAEEQKIRLEQVQATMALLDDENTVPFIARYRKEVTGGLDENQILAIQDRMRYLRALEDRKQTVLKSIAEQGKLTDALRVQIEAAVKLQEVEDLYLPYKPKKRTRATVAREKGLEPLAQQIWAQQELDGNLEEIAAAFINAEKGVHNVEEALAGARDIIAEWVSDDADVRKLVREKTWEAGVLHAEAKDEKNLGVFEMYKDFRTPLKKILPHRTLAINRGETEGFLKVLVEAPVLELLADLEHKFITNPKSIYREQLQMAIKDSYERLVAPAIERELRHQITEVADEHAINIFAANLRHLLMQPPTKGHIIMGIDPGYRTGCKVAVIDETGKFLEGATIYPHEPKNRWDYSKEQLKTLIQKHGVTVIAIGNGTASRETEQLAAELIHQMEAEAQQNGAPFDLKYTIVNEAGASVYSASKLANEEFPDLEAAQRGNISIARRLLDPLAELVKIDPKSIGVGLYQHDVNQTRLGEMLDRVVESCVNNVGVNLNTASAALLRYVAGISKSLAENIVRYRDENGRFASRQQLMEVKGMGPKGFTQCAGFLRIPDSEVFFDSTAIHPESYKAAERFLTIAEMKPQEVRGNAKLLREKLKALKKTLPELAQECGVGLPTLEDIIAALEKPDRDPRDEMPKPIFRQDVLKMEDLKEGMILKGTVRNVVDFGAFVDIGVKQDGLVHLSQMSYKYVKNPLEVVTVGDVIDVRILKVETEKGRISLSMLLEGDRPKPQPKPERPAPSHHRPRRHAKRPHDQRDRKFDKPKPPERIGNTPRIVVDTRKKK
ncbi:MAG: RNA-binding transcriptional accessory protein [candidate division KSB1 bacterium]|nr:RNA-binding transcriptional accessory protein [candidate division KSB1 bacterium]MDZ7364256.1 RNA-binding transcriptional accessory protein [candidate division KSB1 bacterium]MDZ7404979.1 RNA-binding transcriptional accessory protein [candidate division KSB1 bacterium]